MALTANICRCRNQVFRFLQKTKSIFAGLLDSLQKSLPPSFNKWNRAPKEGYAEGVAARLGWKAWLEGMAGRCGCEVWLEGVAERHVCTRRPGRCGCKYVLEGKAASLFWKAWLKGLAERLGWKAWLEGVAERLRGVAGRRG